MYTDNNYSICASRSEAEISSQLTALERLVNNLTTYLDEVKSNLNHSGIIDFRDISKSLKIYLKEYEELKDEIYELKRLK